MSPTLSLELRRTLMYWLTGENVGKENLGDPEESFQDI